jgi:hypothetical protein
MFPSRMGEVPDHVAHFKTIRFQSTITANETKIALHLRFERPVPFNEQSAASESFLSTSRDHHTKRKKSYAKIENSKGQSPTELAGVSTNEVEVKGYQITSCRKKGALMKFYDVAWAQSVYGEALTYDFFRYSEFRNIPSC